VEVPLDTARQRLQGGVASGSLLRLVATSARAGPAVLYSGFAPFLLRTVPLDALQFCIYELLQNLRWQRDERLTARAAARGCEPSPPPLGEAATDMLLGGVAGGVSAWCASLAQLLARAASGAATHRHPLPAFLSCFAASRCRWTRSRR
jgi:hypothetical protein